MIEINLARQIQIRPMKNKVPTWESIWIGILLCLVLGAASWWWTQFQQQNFERLAQEKHVQSQSFNESQATLSRFEKYQEERQRLSDSLEMMRIQQVGKKQPLALLDRVSRSANGLEIWLDRVQMIDQVVELEGQSFSLKDIGKYIDALEHRQLIALLPVVEILDHKDRKNEKTFSFMIRFVLSSQVTT